MDRRDWLRLGAGALGSVGVGALGASALGALDASTLGAAAPGAPFPAQTPGSGQGGGRGPQPPQPPAPGTYTDPRASVAEDWTEPYVWRPSDWPGQPLALHVVANHAPPRATSSGNPYTPLFSFNGAQPGPTIRMRGDETLRLILRNLMPRNTSVVPAGAAPDPFELPPEALAAAFCTMAKAHGLPCTDDLTTAQILDRFGDFFQQIPAPLVDTFCLDVPPNSPAGSHTTNLHTHGLHTGPGRNRNGTWGDDVMLRVLPRGDWDARQQAPDPACRRLHPHEQLGQVDYEHALGGVQRASRAGAPPQPHPPGTHWYHPHAHGATHDQVASGMAGFLIVEGDVDAAINTAMTGEPRPDPTRPTGAHGYRERLMLIQRVEVSSVDFDAGPRRMQARVPPPTAVNGGFAPTVMHLRPGAVERWRVLNASVDGRGFKSFMVLEGHFVFADRQLWRVDPGEAGGAPPRVTAATRADVEVAKHPLHLLAFDGITLVSIENGRARHTIRDLSRRNAGTAHPLARQPEPGEDPARAALRNVEDCYRDGASIRAAYVRPNEVFLANANRADVFFTAPLDAAGKVYTVLAQEFPIATDNMQQRLQINVARGTGGFDSGNPSPVDVVVGYVRVVGDPVPGGAFDVMTLRDALPDVPPWLQPVADDELRVPAAEAAARGVAAGSLRTRVIGYSGYGPTDFPVIPVPDAFAAAHPDLRGRLWAEVEGARILLAPFSRTMAINAAFDLAAGPPPLPRKFGHDAAHPHVLADTAEEWVLYNCSAPLWSHTDVARFPQPGHYALHYRAYPVTRAAGQARFAGDPEFQITTKGADHPFHIHVNPCWVTRIEVPDEQGHLHNVLDEPRWMDTVVIPRAGGRVVFRSRFADYTGTWVHHCHILQHEDFGMMQAVTAVPRARDADYRPRTRVASPSMRADEVSAIYPPPSTAEMYRQNLSFVDPHPQLGYEYPGFDLEPPALEGI
ncbi:MAG: multicopper oxidase domain-containing protein [Vicinamibacterales bacterium]